MPIKRRISWVFFFRLLFSDFLQKIVTQTVWKNPCDVLIRQEHLKDILCLSLKWSREFAVTALIDYKHHQKIGQVRHLLSALCVCYVPYVLPREWTLMISFSPPIAPWGRYYLHSPRNEEELKMMNEQNSRARGRLRYLSENEAETTLCSKCISVNE